MPWHLRWHIAIALGFLLVLGVLLHAQAAKDVRVCQGKGAKACPTPTVTSTPAPTATPTPTQTQTPTVTPTPTPTPTPTATPVVVVTASPTPVPTATPVPAPLPGATLQCAPAPNWDVMYPPIPDSLRWRICAVPPFIVTVYDATSTPYWHAAILHAATAWSVSSRLDLAVVMDAPGTCEGHSTATVHSITVCDWYSDPYAPEPVYQSDGWFSTSIETLPTTPSGLTVGDYITNSRVYFNNWWPLNSPGYGADQANLVACHEFGHGLGLSHTNTYLYQDWYTCLYNTDAIPNRALETLASMYPVAP